MNCSNEGGIICCFRQCLRHVREIDITSDIEFCIDIETSQITVRNHVNSVTNNERLLITSKNYVNKITSLQ